MPKPSWISETTLDGVLLLRPIRHSDSRGFFSEVYNREALEAAGVAIDFMQDNHAFSVEKGTVRGLHFQIPPLAQAKLVRVVRGAILDVVVDIRRGSPSYGKHYSAVISADSWNQILVPVGFAHGLITLEPETEVLYKVSNPYSPTHDKGLLWNDPDLAIEWPITETNAILSDRDRQHPCLSDLPHYFPYDKEAV